MKYNKLLYLCVVLLPLAGGACGGSESPPMPSGEIQWVEIDANELTFKARVAGPAGGDLVLFLHGFPSTSAEWKAQLQALGEAGYRAVAPDQRGYSPQARPDAPGSYQLSHLSADVLAFADSLGVERFHLVGHDWGAVVGWYVAAMFPDRLISLNTISVPHLDAFSLTRSDPNSCQSSASGYIDFFVQPNSHEVMLANDASILRGIWTSSAPEDIAEYLAVLRQPDALRLALDWYRHNNDYLGSLQIGPITVPTMYIWSTGDTALCADGAFLTEDYVTGPYRFEVLEGIDHWVPEAAADEVSDLLIDQLSRVGSS